MCLYDTQICSGSCLSIAKLQSLLPNARENDTKAPVHNEQQQPPILSRQSSKSPEAEALRVKLKKERSKLVLWRRPIQTLHYFLWELLYEFQRVAFGLGALL
jgi:hypothetical protein